MLGNTARPLVLLKDALDVKQENMVLQAGHRVLIVRRDRVQTLGRRLQSTAGIHGSRPRVISPTSTSACTCTRTYICSHNAGASPDTYADPDTAASFERVGSFASRGG
jgi:hypothetical protein